MPDRDPDLVHLRMIAKDGSAKDYWKRADELTPEEAAQYITDQANQRRRDQELLRRFHLMYTRKFGHEYSRLLELALTDIFPADTEAAGA